jgi:predicted dehydrogenase
MELTESGLTVDDGERRDVIEPREDPRVVVDREFVAAVRGERRSTRVPYDEALRTHRLACAVAESARRAEPVRLDDGRMR